VFDFTAGVKTDNIYFAIAPTFVKVSVYNSTTAGDVSFNANINDNAWRHIVWTIDNSGTYNSNIYINNTLTNTFTTNYPRLVSRFVNYMGYNDVVTSAYFNGSIDDFRMYNRRLNTSDISSLYYYNSNNYFSSPNNYIYIANYASGSPVYDASLECCWIIF
jgi:hypothetical protein